MSTVNKAGLEDVVVSTSDICFIDGREGRLIYRGYDVDDLAAQSTFEEVVYLLWYGALPTKKEYDAFYKTLSATATRKLPPKLVALLRGLPKKTTPMEVLRTGVSALSAFDPDDPDNSREAEIRKAMRLTAQMPTLVAAWERIRRGKAPIAPNPKLNLAANFLYMMSGKKPTELAAKTFDVALILHADHEFNASTFAARVTAATLSDMYSAITSAIGALKGPLHGGANEQVMLMVDKIKDPAKAEAWIKKAIADKARIMGFGHRVYRGRPIRGGLARRQLPPARSSPREAGRRLLAHPRRRREVRQASRHPARVHRRATAGRVSRGGGRRCVLDDGQPPRDRHRRRARRQARDRREAAHRLLRPRRRRPALQARRRPAPLRPRAGG